MKLSFNVGYAPEGYNNDKIANDEFRYRDSCVHDRNSWGSGGCNLRNWVTFKENLARTISNIEATRAFADVEDRVMWSLGFENVDFPHSALHTAVWSECSTYKFRLINRFILDEIFKGIPLYVTSDDPILGGQTSVSIYGHNITSAQGHCRVLRHGTKEELIDSIAMVVGALSIKSWSFLNSKRYHAIREKHEQIIKSKQDLPWANTYHRGKVAVAV